MADISANITYVRLTIGRRAASIQYLEVMRLAQHAVLMQSELFTGAELTFAGIAGEAGQMVDVVPGLAHPVACRYASTALGTLGAETSASKQTVFSRIYSFILICFVLSSLVHQNTEFTVSYTVYCCAIGSRLYQTNEHLIQYFFLYSYKVRSTCLTP
jgi:hypothetical protein